MSDAEWWARFAVGLWFGGAIGALGGFLITAWILRRH